MGDLFYDCLYYPLMSNALAFVACENLPTSGDDADDCQIWHYTECLENFCCRFFVIEGDGTTETPVKMYNLKPIPTR